MIIGQLILRGYLHLTLHVTGFKQLPWVCAFTYHYMPYVGVVADYVDLFKYGLLLAFLYKYVFR